MKSRHPVRPRVLSTLTMSLLLFLVACSQTPEFVETTPAISPQQIVIVYSEAVNGELGSLPGSVVIPLAAGVNRILGTIEATPGSQQDTFTISLPALHLLTDLSYSRDAFADGSMVTFGFDSCPSFFPNTTNQSLDHAFNPAVTGSKCVSILTDFNIAGRAWMVDFTVFQQAGLTIDDVAQAEDDSGTTTFTFPVTLDIAVPGGFTVDFSTSSGSALDGDDFTGASSTLTFVGTAGEVQIVEVEVNGDELVELDETFTVTLSNPSSRSVDFLDGTGLGTIQNNDAATLSIGDETRAEGDSGLSDFKFAVTLDQPVDVDVTVQISSSNDSADGSDFQPVSSQLLFSAGAATAFDATAQVTGDTLGEFDETFFMNLALVAAGGRDVAIADSQGLGTILNDDAALNVALGPNSPNTVQAQSGDTDVAVLQAALSVPTASADVSVTGATLAISQPAPAPLATLSHADGVAAVNVHHAVDGDGAVGPGDTLLASSTAFDEVNGTLDAPFDTPLMIPAGNEAQLLVSYDFEAPTAALTFGLLAALLLPAGLWLRRQRRHSVVGIALLLTLTLLLTACPMTPGVTREYQTSLTELTTAVDPANLSLTGLPLAGAEVTVSE